MKEFTSQQKEIVARKLGYDGPMQGFDEFLASNPALQMKYASLSGKFAERMAKGGMVKKYQTGGVVTDRVQQVRDWWAANEGKGTQEDLDRWLATSGFTAAEMNAALPQFAITDLNKAIDNAKAKYEAQQRMARVEADRAQNTQQGFVVSDVSSTPAQQPVRSTTSAVPQSEIEAARQRLYARDPELAAFMEWRLGEMDPMMHQRIGDLAAQNNQNPYVLDERSLASWKATAESAKARAGGNPEWLQSNWQQKQAARNAAYDAEQERQRQLSAASGFVTGPGSSPSPAPASDPISAIKADLSRLNASGDPAELERWFATTAQKYTPEQLSAASGYKQEDIVRAMRDAVNTYGTKTIDLKTTKTLTFDPSTPEGQKRAADIRSGWELIKNDPIALNRAINENRISIGDIAAATGANIDSLQSWVHFNTIATPSTNWKSFEDWDKYNQQQIRNAANSITTVGGGVARPTTPTAGGTTTPTGGGTTPTTPGGFGGATTPTGGGTTTPTTPGGTPGTSGGVTPGTSINLGGSLSDAPRVGTVPTVTAAQTSTEGLAVTPMQAGAATQAQVTQATGAAPVTTGAVAAPTATAAQAAPGVQQAVAGVTGEQGAVSEQAQVTAAQMAPTTTAVSGLDAAQGVAAQVTGAPTRTLETGELISGPAVDQARVEEALTKQQAAQGVVTEEMTVQGQLNKLMQNFDAGNPPPWAAATMRSAAAQMAARGLSASSMAGQAIIQAALEAATPIAAADAKVFETMGLQNLSNRQQMAMLVAQQRAQFLGQEFDQAFQTRVLNAAKISDIANKNFDARTQIAIENARLTNSMDLANLSARNALVLAEAAQISQLETQNLSNLQQAAVENARAFLAMDMKNLDNRQQTSLFKVQAITNAMLQDASLQNAINITNANNKLDADKITQQLKFQADALNLAEQNKISLANALAANELSKFNAQQQNAREEFNANMVNQINVANAKVLAEVSLANTAAINAANALNAKNAVELTSIEYAQLSQTYRDLLEMSWKTGESEKDRTIEIAKATISANAAIAATAAGADAKAAASIGAAAIEVLKNWDKIKSGLGDLWDTLFGD